MRDLVVREALESLAGETGEVLRRALDEGAEVPYEVIEEQGSDAPLYRYRQLVEPFIRSRLHLIRRLESYGPARSVLEATGVVEPYLTHRGVEVPEQQAMILDEALVSFFGRLWEESNDFQPDPERLETALAELEESVSSASQDIELVCPLLGLRMEPERVRMGEVVLAAAETVDLPSEARRLEGTRAAGWEARAIAWTSVEPEGADEASPVAVALQRLHGTISLLRLFAPGSVALGPHAWTRVGRGEWRRIPTGQAAPRPGGYFLAESARRELVALAAALEARSTGTGELGWALRRFEAGCARPSPLDGLTDHLLALRALLEGGGPAEIGLALRVAALCAEPAQRGEVKADVDGAVGLEERVIRGELDADDRGSGGAIELAAAVESLLRAILRDASTGHLGHDLRATADEILLADGLASTFGDAESDDRPRLRKGASQGAESGSDDHEGSEEPDGDEEDEETEEHEESSWLRLPRPPRNGDAHPPGAGEDWFGEARAETLDFPAVDRVERRRDRRSRDGGAADRVRHLFPVPETTEWQVAEPLDRSTAATTVLEAPPEPDIPDPPSTEPSHQGREPAEAPEQPRFEPEQPTFEDLDDQDDEDLWYAPV